MTAMLLRLLIKYGCLGYAPIVNKYIFYASIVNLAIDITVIASLTRFKAANNQPIIVWGILMFIIKIGFVIPINL